MSYRMWCCCFCSSLSAAILKTFHILSKYVHKNICIHMFLNTYIYIYICNLYIYCFCFQFFSSCTCYIRYQCPEFVEIGARGTGDCQRIENKSRGEEQ